MLKPLLKNLLTSAMFSAMFAAPTVHALQMMDVENGQTLHVKISQREMTRIAVDSGRIRDFKYAEEELSVESDTTGGQVFVLPRVSKPVNVFVTTVAGNTYGLVMEQKDIPLETIILKEKSGISSRSGDGKSDRNPVERASSLDKAVQRLIGAMARGERPSAFAVNTASTSFSLWAGTSFVRVAQYRGRTNEGAQFRLTNTGKQPMRVTESEFYKDGVLAVAIEQHQLEPGESTNVFIVKALSDD